MDGAAHAVLLALPHTPEDSRTRHFLLAGIGNRDFGSYGIPFGNLNFESMRG
jgi:hypothetical protein